MFCSRRFILSFLFSANCFLSCSCLSLSISASVWDTTGATGSTVVKKFLLRIKLRPALAAETKFVFESASGVAAVTTGRATGTGAESAAGRATGAGAGFGAGVATDEADGDGIAIFGSGAAGEGVGVAVCTGVEARDEDDPRGEGNFLTVDGPAPAGDDADPGAASDPDEAPAAAPPLGEEMPLEGAAPGAPLAEAPGPVGPLGRETPLVVPLAAPARLVPLAPDPAGLVASGAFELATGDGEGEGEGEGVVTFGVATFGATEDDAADEEEEEEATGEGTGETGAATGVDAALEARRP